MAHEDIRVLIVDSHLVVGGAVAGALNAQPQLAVIDVVATPEAAEELLIVRAVDVLVLDPQTPRMDSIRFIKRIRRRHPALHIIILTDMQDPSYSVAAVQAGVTSWVSKRQQVQDLVAAIRGTKKGESRFPGKTLWQILDKFGRWPPTSSSELSVARLTAREREILRCLVDGLDCQATAERLVLSPGAVRSHIGSVLGKLAVHSQVEAVAVAVCGGIMRPGRTGC